MNTITALQEMLDEARRELETVKQIEEDGCYGDAFASMDRTYAEGRAEALADALHLVQTLAAAQ